MNLQLLSKLQATDSVSLILQSNAGDVITYYIVSRNVTYSIICSGTAEGTMVGRRISFDIRLSSIVPLLVRGYKFKIKYTGDQLLFMSNDEKISVKLSYVESRDQNVDKVIQRYIDFSNALDSLQRQQHYIDTLTQEVKQTEYHMENSGISNMDLFGESTVGSTDSAQNIEEQKKFVEEQKQKIREAQASIQLKELDLSSFTRLAYVASRSHSVVDFCGEYAIVDFDSIYFLQKGVCPVQSIQGQLLYQLLIANSGKGFYDFNDELVYFDGSGTDSTIVFIGKLLPSTAITSSIILKDKVLEKFTVELGSLLDTVTVVKRHFDTYVMDMNTGHFILKNELGEEFSITFEVTDLDSVDLRLRSKGANNAVVFAVIEIPKKVHDYLSLFKNKLVIYVKKRKIIFYDGVGLYLVFGR